MPGLSDYAAESTLEWLAGVAPMPALGSRYLGFFTSPPTSDAGTGGTEVSGGGYARVQVAGAVTAGGAFTTSSTSILLGSAVPAWVQPGMNVYDTTNGQQIGTVGAGSSGSTLNLSGTASHASSGAADALQISAFPLASASSGAEPATAPANVTNGSVITLPTSSANWGTGNSWGLFDALSGGNLLQWDYLGNFKWQPFSCSNASPGVLTSPAHGFAASDPVVVTAKFGGTLPATGGSWSGVLTVGASPLTDTFTAGVNTTGTGDGMVRKITQQSIPANVTFSFAAGTFNLTGA